ncbi:AT-hook motif nuclear-localized protein 9-like [Vicia villosa]|uniref:AT-hook motif nuclear-localized protein 9-like n=1 Tax=Vicia villosa TaxID=3911 RepID=UPI00273C9BF5|nr:AT-hook motif nuclear-localized protein 9-like [Vicia villosa]
MEEDDKNAAAKMIGTSTADPQKEDDDDILPESTLESSLFNQVHINEEPSQTETAATSSKKRKQVGGDVAINNSSTFPLPLDSSPNLTPKKRKEGPSLTTSSETPAKRRRGRPPGSRSKKEKEGPSRATSETPAKRRRGRPPGSRSKKKKEGPSRIASAETPTKRKRGRHFGTGGGKLASHIIELSAGQDVVDVLYKISVENPRKTVTILSALGSVSDIVDLTPKGLKHCKGEFELYFMAIKCIVEDDGCHCRDKATFVVGCKDDKGNLFVNTSVNSLIAAGRVEITATLFNTYNAKKRGARILAFAGATAQK